MDVERALQSVVELASRITGADGAALALRDGARVVCRARTGRLAPELGALLDPESGISGKCLRSGEVQQCGDAKNDPQVDAGLCSRLGIGSILVAPLRCGVAVVGILEVLSSSPGRFCDRDIVHLKSLSGLITEIGLWEVQEVAQPEPLTECPSLPVSFESPKLAIPAEHLPATAAPVPEAVRAPKHRTLWRAAKVLLGTIVLVAGGGETLMRHGAHVPKFPQLRNVAFAMTAFKSLAMHVIAGSSAAGSEIPEPMADTDIDTGIGQRRSPEIVPASPEIVTRSGSADALPPRRFKIVIDPGHGGKDMGAVGPGGLEEKEVVLLVSKRLGEILTEQLGAEVVYTRRDDRNVPLEVRSQIANQAGADLFVSLHANRSTDASAHGSETYYGDPGVGSGELAAAPRENAFAQALAAPNAAAGEDKLRESQRAAAEVQMALSQTSLGHAHGFDRGVKHGPFVVLLNTEMPSILTEIGFISSPSEEQHLRSPQAREAIAESLYSGIARYLLTSGRGKFVAGSAARGAQ